MEQVYEQLLARATALRTQNHSSQPDLSHRIVVALAGPPGSGKSTIAAEIVQRLNKSQSGRALVLPMDGFHLSREVLSAMPNKDEAFARRGVHWTYNAEGVVQLVRALHETRQNRSIIHHAPAFDHAIKDPVEDEVSITEEVDFIILEGNWLLFDMRPWLEISQIVDDTWFVDVDPGLALPRIAKRHVEAGIESNWQDAVQRATNNDMVNGDLVRAKLITPAVLVHSIDN